MYLHFWKLIAERIKKVKQYQHVKIFQPPAKQSLENTEDHGLARCISLIEKQKVYEAK